MTTLTTTEPSMTTTRETWLAVEGMSCSSCIRHIDRALRSVDGVATVEVRLRERRVVVRHDEAMPVTRLVDAIGVAGYQARLA